MILIINKSMMFMLYLFQNEKTFKRPIITVEGKPMEKFRTAENMPNNDFGTHVEYIHRDSCVHFDDREYEDQWQDEVYAYAKSKFVDMKLNTVLDYGCGSGFKLMKYFSMYETIGIELEPALSFLIEKYPDRKWISGESVELSKQSFDMLICSDVIEHVSSPCDLLKEFSSINYDVLIISTPALDLLAERGLSPRLGPPRNESHLREWTTLEFANLVSRFFNIIDHKITNISQCTQMIAATKK